MDKPRRLFRDRPPMPPIPPEVEQLRKASSAIDPDEYYSLGMPDGTILMYRGSTLLKTYDAMVALADAQARGDEAGIVAAMRAIEADINDTGPVMMVCTKVGHARGDIPPGYLTAACDTCGHAAWISPENHERMVETGAKVLCSACVRKPPKTGG